MRSLSSFILLVILVLFASTLQAFIINVPGDYATIQDGINACVDDDTVLVADGTYTGDGNRDIQFYGKAIVLMSENGPDFCIIDCEGSELDQHRGFYFNNGEQPATVLKGFTITNGYTYGGAAIRCDNASPTITDNIITGNFSLSHGGGIKCYSFSSPIIDGNTIVGNTASSWGGGILCEMLSSPIIRNNIITENAAMDGAGILCYKSSPSIEDNIISGNTSSGGGAGIYCMEFASPSIINNTISGNLANGWGGGVHCDSYTSPTLANNIITENIAGYGGGIHCKISSPTIRNNIIARNSADRGGGINLKHSHPIITNNTIILNTADYGGGIHLYDTSLPTLNNCILWENSTDEIYISSGNPVITYSDIQGGWAGEGNIDDDPLFFTYIELPLIFEYFLDNGSPCIDTGDPLIEDWISDWHPLWPAWHNDGPRSDMGAYGGPKGIVGWLGH